MTLLKLSLVVRMNIVTDRFHLWLGCEGSLELGISDTQIINAFYMFSSGMFDISKDPDYSKIYEKLCGNEPCDANTLEEMKFFMSHVDDISMQITLLQVLMYLFHHGPKIRL